LFISCNAIQNVDLIVFNGKIYTIDDQFSVVESMAIKNGKILALGKYEDISKMYSTTQKYDAKGNAIFPGFIDAHCHFTGYGLDLYKLNFIGTQSWQEILDLTNQYAIKNTEGWIYGRGWDQNDWENKNFPDNSMLDSLFPNRPVFLKRIDGHAVIANSKALSLANINLNTKVDGGEIEIKNGKLTGVLIDNAFKLIENIIPKLNKDLSIKYLAQAADSCFKYGLTTVVDCGVEDHVIQYLNDAQQNNLVKMRVVALLSDTAINYQKYLKSGPFKNNLLNINGFKLYSDGALGSRGACLSDDYSDMDHHKGFLLRSKYYFDSIINILRNSKFQVCTHAIGDSANRVILDSYSKYLEKNNDKRWRIEHAQVVHPEDVNIFGAYHIIPSVQPTHATSDMYWAGDRLGQKRLKSAYIYKELLDQNGWMPLGTDFPVEFINPLFTFYSAVARKDGNNFPDNGFQIENALTRIEAIKGMTIWAAKGSFEEYEKGSLEVGKFADFVILNSDILSIPIEETRNTKILSTWVDGKLVYEFKN